MRIGIETEAGNVSSELGRRGISAATRVYVVVEITGRQSGLLPMAEIADSVGAFGWLAAEPDLYSEADLKAGARH